jgi:hypothetical protein
MLRKPPLRLQKLLNVVLNHEPRSLSPPLLPFSCAVRISNPDGDAMTNEFDIAKFRWWNMMKLNQACDMAKQAAETIQSRTRAMAQWTYEPTAGKGLADADEVLTEARNALLVLTEALLAVQVARMEYERMTKPAMQAAE